MGELRRRLAKLAYLLDVDYSHLENISTKNANDFPTHIYLQGKGKFRLTHTISDLHISAGLRSKCNSTAQYSVFQELYYYRIRRLKEGLRIPDLISKKDAKRSGVFSVASIDDILFWFEWHGLHLSANEQQAVNIVNKLKYKHLVDMRLSEINNLVDIDTRGVTASSGKQYPITDTIYNMYEVMQRTKAFLQNIY